MKIYRVFWLVFCGVLGLLGAVVAFTWSLANIIMLVVMVAFTCLGLWLLSVSNA